MSLEFQDTPADPRDYLPKCPRCKRNISCPFPSVADATAQVCRDCHGLELIWGSRYPTETLPDIDVCLACGSH
jgi:hypothetical protein